jgi:hypothetical protein
MEQIRFVFKGLKLSLYRLETPLGLHKVQSPEFPDNEAGKFVSLTHRPPLPLKEIFLRLISARC